MANTDFIPNDFIPDISTTNTTSNPSANPGYFQSLFKTYSPQNNPDLNAILGAGDAFRNTLAAGANLIPGVNIPMAKTGQGTAYNVGNAVGNVGAFIGGGDVLDTARAASEGLPYLGKLAQMLGDNPQAQGLMQQILPGIARRALGTGAYGVATNPNDRAMGGAEGSGESVLADTIFPGLGKLGGMAFDYLQPTTYMQKILNGLRGSQSTINPEKQLSEATQAVIKNVQDASQNQEALSQYQYNPIMNSVGGKQIYNEVMPKDSAIYGAPIDNYRTISQTYSPIQKEIDNSGNSIWNSSAFNENYINPVNNDIDPYIMGSNQPGNNISSYLSANVKPQTKYNGQYTNLPQKITDYDNPDLSSLHDQFINNPTFRNAHLLQSDLGTKSRNLSGGIVKPDANTQNTINSYNIARSSLKNDMNDFLLQESPHLAEMNTNASNNFYENVTPYRAQDDINKITQGDVGNITPGNIYNPFSVPYENASPNLNKIIGDLPPSTMDKVLFTRLKGNESKQNIQSLINNYESLDKAGLSSYISPELKNQISSLKNRANTTSALQSALGATLGAGSLMGHGGIPGGAGLAALGFSLGKPIFSKISNYLPINQLAQGIGNVARGTYPLASNAILANTLNGVNQ